MIFLGKKITCISSLFRLTGQLWGSHSYHFNTSIGVPPHSSVYTILPSLWEHFQRPFIYRTSPVRSVTFISISHSPWGIWTTSESINVMQIQPLLTTQIMIRWSSDSINTLAYISQHMSWTGRQISLVVSVWSSIHAVGLKIWISLHHYLKLMSPNLNQTMDINSPACVYLWEHPSLCSRISSSTACEDRFML